jgi:hypothetical protein
MLRGGAESIAAAAAVDRRAVTAKRNPEHASYQANVAAFGLLPTGVSTIAFLSSSAISFRRSSQAAAQASCAVCGHAGDADCTGHGEHETGALSGKRWKAPSAALDAKADGS